MATDWAEKSGRESGAIIAENFGNPKLPELLWLSGYLAGTRDAMEDFSQGTSEVLNELRNQVFTSVGNDSTDENGPEAA